MQIESITQSGYKIFRIRDKIVADSDIEEVAKEVEKELKKGRKKIALSFLPATYPYSPVLSSLTRCHRTAELYDATVSVVSAKQEFLDVLLETHLDRVFEICRSEEELGKAAQD